MEVGYIFVSEVSRMLVFKKREGEEKTVECIS